LIVANKRWAKARACLNALLLQLIITDQSLTPDFFGVDSDQAALDASLASFRYAPGSYKMPPQWSLRLASHTVRKKKGPFGSVRADATWATLTEDNAFPLSCNQCRQWHIGQRFDNGWSVPLDLLNLLATGNQITYEYSSLIKTESLFGPC
jgi:hypothetical protein